MKREVEILVEVIDKKSYVLKKLRQLNFLGARKTLDIYFYDPVRKNLKPEKNNRLKECFRLRTKNNISYLTYKVDHFDKNGKWLYSDEHETEVANDGIALEIIKHLGLKELVKIENRKLTFLTNDYEIVLEDVKNLGLFMEVEALNTKPQENVNKVKDKILNFISSLNIKVSRELNSGKPELMLKKMSINENPTKRTYKNSE